MDTLYHGSPRRLSPKPKTRRRGRCGHCGKREASSKRRWWSGVNRSRRVTP